jgi:hypothetical protein
VHASAVCCSTLPIDSAPQGLPALPRAQHGVAELTLSRLSCCFDHSQSDAEKTSRTARVSGEYRAVLVCVGVRKQVLHHVVIDVNDLQLRQTPHACHRPNGRPTLGELEQAQLKRVMPICAHSMHTWYWKSCGCFGMTSFSFRSNRTI